MTGGVRCYVRKDCSDSQSYCYNCGINLCRKHYRVHSCIQCPECREPCMIQTGRNYKEGTFTAKCKNGHIIKGKLLKKEWQIPIDMKYVRFATKLLKEYPVGRKIDERRNIVRGETAQSQLGECVILGDTIYTGGSNKSKRKKMTDGTMYSADAGANFYRDSIPLDLHYNTYIIKFSVPQSQIYDEESFGLVEYHTPHELVISQWAYENCYMEKINKALEKHGKMLFSMILKWSENMPMFRHSPYRELIISIKKNKDDINYKEEKKKLPKKIVEKEEKIMEIDDNIPVIYTDGAGNLYKGEKRSKFGHYSVYINKEHKYKKKEDRLTSNEAEIKGVIGGIVVAEDLGMEEYIICTDSQNVCKWLNGRGLKICVNITDKNRTLQDNIIFLIDKLEELLRKHPKVRVKWVGREKNKAHSI